MRAQGKVHQEHPASQMPPKSWVLGSDGGVCAEHAGSQSCRAVQPDVGEAPALQVKVLPRRGAEVAHVVHRHRSCALDVPTSPARSGPVARVCLAPWASQKPQLSRRGVATSSPDRGTTRPRAGLAASCPWCQTPHSGHRAAVVPVGTPLPPRCPGLAGELGCGRIRPPCPTPALRGARIKPGPEAGAPG